MKTATRTALAFALAALAVSPALSGGIDGSIHVGHTGDVRALLANGRTLWIGTGGGLFRYDLGSDEFVEHVIVGERLPSSSIRSLGWKDGSVLVGTDRGLAVFDGATVRVYTDRRRGAYDSLAFDHVRGIDIGPSGDVFLSTFGRGVGVMQPDGGRAITREDSLLDDKVYGVVETDDGALYFATSMGLCAYRDSAWVGFQAGAGIPRGEVRDIIDASGHVYLLVGVGGVFRFEGDRARELSPLGIFPQDDVAALTRDDRGNLWAAGRFGGLGVYQGGRWKRIAEGEAAIDGARWRSAHADADGGVYFGSADGLVAVVRDNILRKIQVPQELPSGSVRSIVAADDGVYFLSGSRLVRSDSSLRELSVEAEAPQGLVSLASGGGELWAVGRWGVFRAGEGAFSEVGGVARGVDAAFASLCLDGRGRVWVSERSGRIVRYDGELWLPVATPEEVFGGPVDGLTVGAGATWAFTRQGGVARFDGVTWRVFPADSFFVGEELRDLAVSAQGAVVAATPKRLWLYRDDTQRWRPVGFSDGVASDSVRAFVSSDTRAINRIVFDRQGRLYIGTEDGIGLLGGGGLRWLDASDGLGGAAVVDILVQGEDAVWVGFRSDGLTRIPMKSLW